MPQVKEGEFTFDFPGDWICKLDDTKFYREKMKHISGGQKAVDIVFNLGTELCFLEVKDYRQNLAGLKEDLKERLPNEVSQKWQNSLSTLLLGGRIRIPAIQYDQSGILTQNIPMRYFLFLETPPITHGGTATAIKLKTHDNVVEKIQNLSLKLSSNLKPFGCPVSVCSMGVQAPNQPFTVQLGP